MVDLFPTPATALIESTTRITEGLPVIGNGIILADSIWTTGRAAVNLYCSPNPISKICFTASILCGSTAALSSGTAMVTSVFIPGSSVVGAFGARAFNRLGKYTLHMGNVTSGNITNATDIADLMS